MTWLEDCSLCKVPYCDTMMWKKSKKKMDAYKWHLEDSYTKKFTRVLCDRASGEDEMGNSFQNVL